MQTPIADFVREYARKNVTRLHMPGHKGVAVLGCEPYDITEIPGADALYEAKGIIAESQTNAAALFGAAATVYSTEGSSQCIRAMVHLAANRVKAGRAWFLAARNAHKAFLYALALEDADVQWLWPQDAENICACSVTAEQVEQALLAAETLPAAVYLTSPDYLGTEQPLAEIAEVCHRFGTLLLVDNAHGAYLHFLPKPRHPLDLGADLCCDSAHKTLPVLTGGAYLHISYKAADLAEPAVQAMALFGSTSPSYLVLSSLDLCNRYLAENGRDDLERVAALTQQARAQLRKNGWQVLQTEPLKLTIRCSGLDVAQYLRTNGVECEFADRDYLVCMVSVRTTQKDLQRLLQVMGENRQETREINPPQSGRPDRAMTVRQAVYAPQEMIPVEQALGRICAAPVVSCPPAIPIAVSGEVLDEQVLTAMRYYGAEQVSVVIA